MLKLIPPGKRRNKYYVVRGRFLGVDVETSTETDDSRIAAAFKRQLEKRIAAGAMPSRDSAVLFHKAIDLYKQAHKLSDDDLRRYKRIEAQQPNKPCAEIVQADLDILAQALHPSDSNETKNRNVYTPCIAVLRYAALNKWCAPLAFKRPRQKKPETRAASDKAATALLSATEGPQRLFIAWIFYHGTRVSNALQVRWDRIDLDGEAYSLFVKKSQQWQVFPLHAAVATLLREIPAEQRKGLLFPWKSRWRVYDWLTPLRVKLGVTFTPHMARHWLGKKLDAAGAGQRAIADALGQSSTRSTQRYTSSDLETVRRFGSGVKIGESSEKST
jgi:integrase/recombinase XerD